MTLPTVPNVQQGRRIDSNSILFLKDLKMRFPFLTKLSLTLISNPSFSAKSERLFSASEWLCDGKRNRLENENLAAQVFISCNKDLLRDNIFL